MREALRRTTQSSARISPTTGDTAAAASGHSFRIVQHSNGELEMLWTRYRNARNGTFTHLAVSLVWFPTSYIWFTGLFTYYHLHFQPSCFLQHIQASTVVFFAKYSFFFSTSTSFVIHNYSFFHDSACHFLFPHNLLHLHFKHHLNSNPPAPPHNLLFKSLSISSLSQQTRNR